MSTSPPNILVVEDHANSRDMLCEMLAVLNYRAYCVPSAEDALEPLKTEKFDILIADINLPGMSGIEFARMAVKSKPGLKVIFASGYGYLVADKTDFHFVLLPKPFDLIQLERALKEV